MNHDHHTISLGDLVEEWADDQVPYVDRADAGFADLSPWLQHWRTHGWAVAPDLIDDATIDAYCDEWQQANGDSPGGWSYCTPHRDNPALAALVCDQRIQERLQLLLGEPAGVHLTLTGWRTTTRDFHQDCYLNPPEVGGYYVAVWIALDDIDPRSGPFQYIDASHLWPPLSQAKVKAALGDKGRGPDWPTRSEELLTPLYEAKIADEDLAVVDYIPRRGDVLYWHSRLLHRGSRAEVPGMERRALIAHFSGLSHRPDMPPAYPHGGGFVFPVDDRNGLPPEQLTGGQ